MSCRLSVYEHGGKLLTHRHRREVPEAKTTNYITMLKHRSRVGDEGALDLLYHDGHQVTEAASASVYFVRGSTILAPKDSVLWGTTGSYVLDLAEERYEVVLCDISLEEALSADEAFLTSTTRGVVPIVALARRSRGRRNGRPRGALPHGSLPSSGLRRIGPAFCPRGPLALRILLGSLAHHTVELGMQVTEDVRNGRVEVRATASEDDVAALLVRCRRLVDAPRAHRIVDVRDRHDACTQRDLFTCKPVGVATAIPALVMRADDLDAHRQEGVVRILVADGLERYLSPRWCESSSARTPRR